MAELKTYPSVPDIMKEPESHEGQCSFCGNHTEVRVTEFGKYTCAVCAGLLTTQEALMSTGQNSQPTKTYTIAIPNLASDTQHLIAKECIDLARTLLDKNRKYGDSALAPLRIFSKAAPDEQIRIRIDDKLTRIINRAHDEDEDAELDLIGYLILLRVWRRLGIGAAT